MGNEMQKSLQAKIRLCVAMLLVCGLARAQASEAASLMLPDMPLHDPWMLANEADKTYYLYT